MDSGSLLDLGLDEIVSDPLLCGVFQSFLEKNYMSVSFELWLDILRYEEAEAPKRREVYNQIFEKYFKIGCPCPMSFSSKISKNITQYNQSNYLSFAYGPSDEPPLPYDLFKKAKDELWVILQWTSIPSFLKSDAYQDIRNGVNDSSKNAFSRMKCEYFFGQSIAGPLQRCELVDVIQSASHASKKKQQRRLKEELNFQDTTKKTSKLRFFSRKSSKRTTEDSNTMNSSSGTISFKEVEGSGSSKRTDGSKSQKGSLVDSTGRDAKDEDVTENIELTWAEQDPHCSYCGSDVSLALCAFCGTISCGGCGKFTLSKKPCTKAHKFDAEIGSGSSNSSLSSSISQTSISSSSSTPQKRKSAHLRDSSRLSRKTVRPSQVKLEVPSRTRTPPSPGNSSPTSSIPTTPAHSGRGVGLWELYDA
jgi:hypothetical protein